MRGLAEVHRSESDSGTWPSEDVGVRNPAAAKSLEVKLLLDEKKNAGQPRGIRAKRRQLERALTLSPNVSCSGNYGGGGGLRSGGGEVRPGRREQRRRAVL